MWLPERTPQLDFIRTFIDGFGEAASAADFKHPSTGQHYSEFIDVDGWIDHHIINTLAKNVDGLRYSAYFHKERGGRLAAGPLWDFDRSFGTPQDPRAMEPEEWSMTWSDGTDYFNEGWWRLLFRDPDFRSRYRERFKRLLNGEFSADSLDRIVDALAAEVGDAAPRNFTRWTQSPPQDNSYAAEIALLKDFLRRRVAWIEIQLDTSF
jgi:spore coat protein CotH